MIVNGTLLSINAANSIGELLATLGLKGKRVAIECNGRIVPRSKYDTTQIAAEDRIEIVAAVGGG